MKYLLAAKDMAGEKLRQLKVAKFIEGNPGHPQHRASHRAG
jgi:hypothetical protein